MNRYQLKNTLIIFSFIVIFYSLFIPAANCQYYGERVQEKSFEQMDFFFHSTALVPYGLGNFQSVVPGLLDDPLLNLVINPANIYSDSSRRNFLFMDFRNSHAVQNNGGYDYPRLGYDGRYANNYVYFPSYYVESRKALEPVFTGAWLSRPFRKKMQGLFLGATYQAIFQNEDYYAVPQDIYRAGAGLDYEGNKMSEDDDMPIVDRYRGSDEMHQTGHFLSLFSGYELNPKLRVGFKLGRAIFKREGSLGDQNLYENYGRYENSSVWFSDKNRRQDYSHWDFSGGLNYKVTQRLELGLSAGCLWGEVEQSLEQQDSSRYAYGQIDTGNEWSYHRQAGFSSQKWNHDGRTLYAGLNGAVQLSAFKTIKFNYKFTRQDVDLVSGSNLVDSAYSNYRSTWENSFWHSVSDYALQDYRTGTGTQEFNQHRFALNLAWKMESNKQLDFGIQVNSQERVIKTQEDIQAKRHNSSFYQSDNAPDGRERYQATDEDKNLTWSFRAKLVNFQIPFLFRWKLTKSVEMLFGVNRKIASWRIDDVTLARFNYRKQTDDSTTTEKINFGERYTQPSEKISEVKTTLLGGVTIAPSDKFNIRFLVVPNFSDEYYDSFLRDVQWWIALNLFP